MHRGYIKDWRKSLDNPLFKKPLIWHFWGYCLKKTSHKDRDIFMNGQMISIKRGQFVFGRKIASEETGLSEQQIRTCLKHLEKVKNLTSISTNKYSIITIINWDTYQQDDKKSTNIPTNNQPAINQQSTTDKNVKHLKNEKKHIKTLPQNETSPHLNGEDVVDFYLTKKKKKLSGKRLEAFDKFWDAFNYKKDRANAADSWMDIKYLDNALVEKICIAAKHEAEKRHEIIDMGKIPIYAQGWLSSRRWEDDQSAGQKETLEEYIKRKGLE
jgi:hypothetical protein